MVTLGQEKLQALRALCGKYAVRQLKLFGSAASEGFDPERSDLDFLVEFGPPPKGMRLGTQFFGMLEDLEILFGRRVDLLEEHAIQNSRLRRNAVENSVTLYAA